MARQFGLEKNEKLKSRKLIDELFQQGKSFPAFPLRVIYRFLPAAEGGVQIGVSASKRNFKKAVDRNRLKRLMREAYRLQKEALVQTVTQQNLHGFVFFMYTNKELSSFNVVSGAMKKSLDRLQKIAQTNEVPS